MQVAARTLVLMMVLVLSGIAVTSDASIDDTSSNSSAAAGTELMLRSKAACDEANVQDEPVRELLAGSHRSDHLPAFETCSTGIRPGARMVSPAGCTLNFVFSEGSDLYIGTAAHCVGGPGQGVSAQNVGSFGTVEFSGWGGGDSTLANDFALIKINSNKHFLVNPAMCTWGGPTGVGTGTEELVVEYGWGIATQFSAYTRARVHDEAFSTATRLSWNGVGSGGDSGAPVLYSDGRAAGIHTAGLTPIAGVVLEQGPTIQRILTLTSEAGYDLQLETADARWLPPA